MSASLPTVAIVGGETHLSEITQLQDRSLQIVGTCMKAEQRRKALPGLEVTNYADQKAMLAAVRPDIVAIANENDLKFAAIMESLKAGCDVIVDKPLCLTFDEQRRMEDYLTTHPERRLLNLLTLRGNPPWLALREQAASDAIGSPAFVHIRMAVQLKRANRPPWFLDCRRSGGMFLDLLIHGLDQVEWLTGTRITAVAANTGNLSDPADPHLRDHAAVYCELDNGGSAVVDGQRLLPATQGSDYRALAAGSAGYLEMRANPPALTLTNAAGAGQTIENLPAARSIVQDWLEHGRMVPQEASLRANRLALLATRAAETKQRLEYGAS
jgi:predicted dehydrogenase